MEYLVVFLGLMVLLFALGVPIAVSIGLTCLAVVAIDGGLSAIPTELFALQMMRGLNNFPILAIPFFIFAASLMNVGSVTNRIFDFANALVGFIRGGLGHVNVVASMIFAGMSATAVADVAGIGQTSFTLPVLAGNTLVGTIIVEVSPQFVETRLREVFLDVLVIVLIVEGMAVELRREHDSLAVEHLRELRG